MSPTAADPAVPSVWSARLDLIVAAALFSTGGAFIKSCALAPLQVAGLRSLIAALFLLALWPASRRGWSLRSFLFATLYATTMIAYVSAMKWTTAANAIFLQSTAPLFVLLLSPFVLGEKVRRADLLFMVALAAGVALCVADHGSVATTAPDPLRGNLFAVASGVAWGATIVGLRWFGRKSQGSDEGAAASIVAGNVVCFAGAWALTSLQGADFWPAASFRADPAFQPTLRSLLFLGMFQVGLAYRVLSRGMKRVPAVEASLLLLVEPVFNPLWAYFVHGERPGASTLTGGGVILLATAVHALATARAAPASGAGA
jgi:drug/metabolite transporter (DMT)-like permease